ncbi:MAG: hypothetical protein ACPLZG_08685 [Thermoproteota archaeon]|jgi:hypothetical protein
MPVIIQSKTPYQGTVTPSALNTETTVIEIKGQRDDYIIDGYLDLSALASGDTVVVTEYIKVDGVNYRVYAQVTYSGALTEPIIRFYAKLLITTGGRSNDYKITIKQTAGTLRSFPYSFLLELMGTI